MAVGAFAAYNVELRVAGLPLLGSFVLAGGRGGGRPRLRPAEPAAARLLSRGLHAGGPVLRAVVLTKFGWFSNYSASGVIAAPPLSIAGSPRRRRSAATSCPVHRHGADRRGDPAGRVADRPQFHRRARQRDRRPDHRRAGAADQAAGLRDQSFYHRRRGRARGPSPICARSSRTASISTARSRSCSSSSSAASPAIRGAFFGAAFIVSSAAAPVATRWLPARRRRRQWHDRDSQKHRPRRADHRSS